MARVIFSLTGAQARALRDIAHGAWTGRDPRVFAGLEKRALATGPIQHPSLTPLGQCAASLAKRLASAGGIPDAEASHD